MEDSEDELNPQTGLIKAVEKILERKLTSDEATMWANVQETYGISDDDPLVIVLVMLGVHAQLAKDLPLTLRKVSTEIVEAHRATLAAQSGVIAKDLIRSIAPSLANEMRIISAPAKLKFWIGLVSAQVLTGAAVSWAMFKWLIPH